MKIPELFKKRKIVFSFEIFPPKKDGTIDTVYKTLDELGELRPDFISVTYGAGGSAAGCSTVDIASIIKEKYHTESIAHLTCVNSSFADIDAAVEKLKEKGIENVLALRGDINPDIPPKNDFSHASELITYMKKRGEFSFSGACYPECHAEAADFDEDIKNLKAKVDAGAEHLISQLFFDNERFYEFMERVRGAGITVPVEAGIMPCVNAKQVSRMVTMCGAGLPSELARLTAKYKYDDESMLEAGIEYAARQITELAAHGVDGIHLYTMNNPYVAKRIAQSVEKVIRQ